MPAQKEWWRDFFSGVVLDVWRAVTNEEQTRVEADFIEKVLQLPRGAKILDVPCGGGRLALELAARGYEPAGVDIASDFIREAQSKAAERKLAINLEQRDMRELPWQNVFDGAFCLGNSFGYMDDEGNEAFLNAISRALKPGARFILETAVAESMLPDFRERCWHDLGGILFLEHQRYDHVRGGVETEYTFVAEGKVEKRIGWQRTYSYSELCGWLARLGLVKPEGYGSFRREAFRIGSERLFLVTTKAVEER